MFTGIIEEIGEVIEISDTGEFRTIRVRGRERLAAIAAGISDRAVRERFLMDVPAHRALAATG